MNKDLFMAGGILVVCLVILIAASSEPEGPSDTGNSGSGDIASVENEIPVAGQEDPIPGMDDAFDDIDSALNGDDGFATAGNDDTFNGTDDIAMNTGGDAGSDVISIVDLNDSISDDSNTVTDVFNIVDDPVVNTGSTPEDTGVRFDLTTTDENSHTSVTPTHSGGDQIHVVASGDMLGSISQKWYGSTRYWKNIRDMNNVYENELQVGQRLIIPSIDGIRPQANGATRTSARSPNLESGQRMYTVKRGDSYYMIAQRELGDSGRYKEVQALNGTDAYELMPGTQIILPANSRAGVRTQTTPRTIAGARVHIIASGETLSDISVKYYGTARRWREIAAANGNVDPGRLNVGTKLQIPQAESGGARRVERVGTTPRIRPSASNGSQEYIIQRGDTLGEISQKFYGTSQKWKRIQRANSGLNPNKMPAGKKITIPAADGSTPAPRREVERVDGATVDFGGT